jgi:CRISPR-associated endonuclease/helicase Cas3
LTNLEPSGFSEFFQAVQGHTPFPWQEMLVERVLNDGWPEGIDLPTASGKTACIDIAVFLLALGAQQNGASGQHPGRRRMFFVVDRRIVVDEAYDRARRLASALKGANGGVVGLVAERLRNLAGTGVPLVVSRLRGGTLRDEDWRLNPMQPAVVTSTVDQIGSRLLFRSYGSSSLSAPIEAGLTGCDSLVLLDEAHCAVPFLQTARAVQRYAGPDWLTMEETVAPPIAFSILSATLPDEVEDIFPGADDRDTALTSAVLEQRTGAAKPAELVEAKKPTKRKWSLGEAMSDDPLVLDAAQRATDLAESGEHRRIAVMVNRVATAAAIADQLRAAVQTGELDADIALMTGRMRPIDRDEFVSQWSPILRASAPEDAPRPVILVTTQCLEVGADFSFDALITECASLDALRQRFGRLNRLGEADAVAAAVLVRKSDAKPEAKLDDEKRLDFIYGNALARTWNWLNANAEDGHFDFGISAVQDKLSTDRDQLAKLMAPSPDAPVLLPAHVDLLCQTAPVPVPDPDVSLFLHGPDRGRPEVRVVFRADLCPTEGRTWQQDWVDSVTLLPPLSAEALTVPLPILRHWLARQQTKEATEALGDVEGQQLPGVEEPPARGQPFVIWRGRHETEVSFKSAEVRPNETIVLPADEDLAASLGAAFTRVPRARLDIAETAYQVVRQQPVLRLVPEVLADLVAVAPVAELLKWARDEDRDLAELSELLQRLAQHEASEDEEAPALPPWLKKAAERLAARTSRIEPHPARGVVLFGPPVSQAGAAEDLTAGDADDSLSAADGTVSLESHIQDVAQEARPWAERSLPDNIAQAIATAARLHDLGKADLRFQIVLHGDEVEAARNIEDGNLLAKSRGPGTSRSGQRRLRNATGLPKGFRHELLSMQMVEAAQALQDEDLSDLALHLVASHHGYGRPLAPVVQDPDPPAVQASIEGAAFNLTGEARRQLIPPHRIDSGVAERFWRLTRRYGWWGLAYLEAVLRIADRRASAAEAASQPQSSQGV